MEMKLEGFSELEDALDDLSKSAGRGVLRRSLKKAAEPTAELVRSRINDRTGNLSGSIKISSKLVKSEYGKHRAMFRDEKAAVELFLGPSYDLGDGGRHGHLVEFGTVHSAPHPFMRPAWDQDQQPILDRLGQHLWAEFEKSLARAQRKAAKG